MTIERARPIALPKPWRMTDIGRWKQAAENAPQIGEICFERFSQNVRTSQLLLKMLFAKKPLSVQVHPDDRAAKAMGLLNGKSEAWYILDAARGAKVAVGPIGRLDANRVRRAIKDGSIESLLAWRPVVSGEIVLVPAGTIHAIGAGIILAEIQQRSDTTFRLFDYGSSRELHVDNALAVATLEPTSPQAAPTRIDHSRMLLASGDHFILERFDLPANTDWRLNADQEIWLLVISGRGHIGRFDCKLGEALFARSAEADITVRDAGLSILAAYTPPGPFSHLLQGADPPSSLVIAHKDREPASPVATRRG
ncbi:class I mannose-6-phosphate isomerase [Terrarubrum flagellatum]|uniref:class I mannose-6-phosphate isomerase n=1 Tax=Terrirubrum flagellatum TaxID=2895980 RepID=UPI003144FE4B